MQPGPLPLERAKIMPTIIVAGLGPGAWEQVTLEERLGRAPEDSEVAVEAGIPVQQLRDLSRQAKASANHANLDDFDLADEFNTAADHGIEEGDMTDSLMRVAADVSAIESPSSLTSSSARRCFSGSSASNVCRSPSVPG